MKNRDLLFQPPQKLLVEDVASLNLFVLRYVSEPLLLNPCHIDEITFGSGHGEIIRFNHLTSFFLHPLCYLSGHSEKARGNKVEMDPEVRENLYQGMNGSTIPEITHQSDRKILKRAQPL